MTSAKHPRLRLGRGDYTRDEEQTWAARRAFLKAVYAVSSDTYWSLFPDGPGDEALAAWHARYTGDIEAMIAAWQKHWHLNETKKTTDAWLTDVARNTLRQQLKWHVEGTTYFWGIDRFATPQPRGSLHADPFIRLSDIDLYWNPAAELWEHAEQRILAALRSERDRIAANVTSSRTRTKEPEHFIWLARYQVRKENKEDIAASVGVALSSVVRGVNTTAKFIELELRQPKRGRPRKNAARTVKILRNRTRQ